MDIILAWILFSFVVAYIGNNRSIGFWNAFFISLILSPLIGLIFVLFSKNNDDEKYKQKILETQRSQEESLKRLSQHKTVQKISIADELEKLLSLKNKNIITDEEFIRLKSKIIETDIDNVDDNIIINDNKETTSTINKSSEKPPLYGNPNFKAEKTNYLNIIYIIFGVIILFLIIQTCDKNKNVSNYDFTDTISEVIIDTIPTLTAPTLESNQTNEYNLKYFSFEDVSRYAIATIMQQPVVKIKSQKKDDFYYVWYIRTSDSQKFEYKVKFIGNNIVWGDLRGRWQDSEYDEKITFEEIGNKIHITDVGQTLEYNYGD